ncbi:Cleavage stimulation factor 64 kDa subunit [Wickerhamomyces ciferrii]|uniref:Cleavage stimulation factor 64 kDa subunit n=1 Tax=Wickerhamomyces ciferrii (strain ATCC 14091 / BCRC 22168 / CBS 111 / JCM 3599 / NBRC 0793 / NRRL Y-1031 F-60-10) TaxID=1206466 RepID=K0KHG2_WICCF|nr:Cleavage stimulation factor 64 kDa subunit [Wickerhamomyces ciferrii]CCH40779.1 Cleavage stimulation factor 64 kDa subunit [Wickerhamomyces ciferrii]
MMFDKETGKSKGFAFVEYPDVETASSAVRNLNNYSIGNRSLKCDFSNENSLSSNGSSNNNNNNNNNNQKSNDTLPPLPPGIQLPQGLSYADSISKTLQSLDDTRKLTLIEDAKEMAKRNPSLMNELLTQCPQLSYALVETLLITGTSTPEDITKCLISNDDSTVKQEEQTPEQSQQQEEEELDEEKLALIKQVLAISDEELAEIPEDQRASIVQIKENAKNGVYGNII